MTFRIKGRVFFFLKHKKKKKEISQYSTHLLSALILEKPPVQAPGCVCDFWQLRDIWIKYTV